MNPSRIVRYAALLPALACGAALPPENPADASSAVFVHSAADARYAATVPASDAVESSRSPPRSAEVQNLRSVALPPRAIDMAECLSMLELRPGLLSGVCRDASDESELHLVIVEVTASGTVRTYTGPGAGDAYYMRQTVLASGAGDPSVVLAESGAELSYGIGVYLIAAPSSVTYAGELAVGVSDGENVVSAAPFVLVEWDASGLCLRFTRDLVYARADGSYSVLSRDGVAFVYASGRLREVNSCASRRERAESILMTGPSR